MKVVVYGSPEASERLRCLAVIVSEGKVQPVQFFGRTASEVRTKAQTWWDEQLEAIRKRAAADEARAEARRRRRVGGNDVHE